MFLFVYFIIKSAVITRMVFTVYWPVVTVETVNNVITWHHVTGTCPQGCVQGYDGDTCDTSNSFFLLFEVRNTSLVVCFRFCIYYKLSFFSGVKIMYVTANDQVGLACYGLLAPLIVSVLCNALCLMRLISNIIAICLSYIF